MLTIFRSNGYWMVDWSRSKDAKKVFALFGSYIIDTPFDDESETDDVLIAIQRENPFETVSIGEDR
jgi:hypothetical protein